MAFRFSDPGAPPVPRVGWPSTNLIFDQRLGRWRWAFQAALEVTRDRQGRDLTTAEAVATLEPELTAALGYIAAQVPDDNVFGVVYSTGGPLRVAGGDATKGATSLKNALATVDKALSPVTPDYLRGGLLGGAIGILYSALKDYAPNDLSASGSLVRSLHAARRPLEALAEWAHLYCRAVSAASVFQRVPHKDDPTHARVAQAYQPFLTTLLPDVIESHALVLDARRLYDPARLAGLPLLPSALDEVGGYIEVYHVNWLYMVSESRDSMAFFQLGVGTVGGMKRVLLRYFEWWKASGLQTYTPRMKRTLVKCVGVLEPLLVKDIPGANAAQIRVAACQALAEIPLQETIDALGRHRQHPDAAVRTAVDEAIRQIASRLGIR